MLIGAIFLRLSLGDIITYSTNAVVNQCPLFSACVVILPCDGVFRLRPRVFSLRPQNGSIFYT